MRLERIKGHGIHGMFNFDVPIEPVNIVLGENEAGKSSLIGLIPLVLRGDKRGNYPVLGQSPDYSWWASVTFDLSDGDTDDHLTVERRKAKGRSQSVFIDGEEIGVRAAPKEMAERFGEASIFSMADLLDKTTSGQLDWLETNVLAGALVPVKDVQKKVLGVLPDDAIDTWTRYTDPSDKERKKGKIKLDEWMSDVTDGRKTLSRLIDALADAHRGCSAEIRRLKGAVEQYEQEDRGELPAGTVPYWEGKLAELEAQLGEQREALGAEKVKDEARAMYDEQLADVDEKVSELNTDDARERKASHLARIASITDEISQRNHRIEQLMKQIAGINVELQGFKDRVMECNANVLDLTSSGAIAAHRAFRAAVMDLLDLAENMAPEQGQLIREVFTTGDQAAERLAEVQGILAGYRVQIAAKERQHASVSKDLHSTEQDIHKGRRALDQEKAKVAELERWISNAEKQTRELMTRRDELLAAMERAGSGNIEPIEIAISGIETEQAEVKAKIRLLNDAAQGAATYQQRLADKTSAEKHRTAIRDAQAKVKEIQAEVLRSFLAGFVKPVSAATCQVLGCSFDATVEDGTVDYYLVRPGGDRIHLDTASNSQRIVTIIAMRAAIIDKLGGWRGLVVDDLEAMDDARRATFLDTMTGLVQAGMVDTFIGSCVGHDRSWINDDTNIIDLAEVL